MAANFDFIKEALTMNKFDFLSQLPDSIDLLESGQVLPQPALPTLAQTQQDGSNTVAHLLFGAGSFPLAFLNLGVYPYFYGLGGEAAPILVVGEDQRRIHLETAVEILQVVDRGHEVGAAADQGGLHIVARPQLPQRYSWLFCVQEERSAGEGAALAVLRLGFEVDHSGDVGVVFADSLLQFGQVEAQLLRVGVDQRVLMDQFAGNRVAELGGTHPHPVPCQRTAARAAVSHTPHQ